MLPNLIITGFPKCGTTSLFKWLCDHPQVEGSTVKETNYFIDLDTDCFNPNTNFHQHGLAGYESFFPANSSAAIILEATPQYAYQATALAQLPQLASSPKFIFILRHPAEQILSSYRYYRSNFNLLDPKVTFANFVALAKSHDGGTALNGLIRDALANCDYERVLQKWAARVGTKRILVYFFEDITADARRFVERVACDIGIDPGFYRNYSFAVENYSYNLRSYALHQLNIRIREILPMPQRSELWRALRSFYRKINTLPGQEPMSDCDRDALQALKAEWDPRYRQLVSRYALSAAAPARGESGIGGRP